jgi:hypothetical protein
MVSNFPNSHTFRDIMKAGKRELDPIAGLNKNIRYSTIKTREK